MEADVIDTVTDQAMPVVRSQQNVHRV